PLATRHSITISRPSIYPASLSPRRKESAALLSGEMRRNPIRLGDAACCARAVSGHAIAKPTIALTKSRRRIACPKAQDHAKSELITAEIYDRRNGGSGVGLRGSDSKPLMSALGQKRTSEQVQSMSALPPKADIGAGTCITFDAATPAAWRYIRRDPSRLVARKQFRRRSPSRFVLEIDVAQRLTAGVAHDETRGLFLDCPRRREAARGGQILLTDFANRTAGNNPIQNDTQLTRHRTFASTKQDDLQLAVLSRYGFKPFSRPVP